MTQPKLSIQNLHKSFNNHKVLSGVNMDIYPGESLVIIGGSGTGKSVLLKCLLGLQAPETGFIAFNGQQVTSETRPDFLDKVGMVFQGSALFDSQKIWENVAFRLIHKKKINKNEMKNMAIEKLATVGLSEHVADLLPSEISGGMQRRVAIARAIVDHPEILLFDEPTAGLDPIFSSVINELIRKCTKELGATAITITHDMKSARHIGDRIAMLHQGQIIWCGTTKEIDSTDNPYVHQFIKGLSDGPIQTEVQGGPV